MTHQHHSPSTTEPQTILDIAALRGLADAIARDGLAAHPQAVERLARQAERSELYPASVEILRDPTAAPTQRARAFTVLHRNWNSIRDALETRAAFDTAFDRLADQWMRHQDLRASGDIAALWASRRHLDARRAEACAARP